MKAFKGWTISVGLLLVATAANAQGAAPQDSSRPHYSAASDFSGPYGDVPPGPAVSFWMTVHVNDAVPDPPRASAAVTVTVNVPELVGEPVIRPAALIDTPLGRPVALKLGAKPAF